MATHLLETKFYTPPIRREYVPRSRLYKLLEAGLACKLTLVSAPAGYGKTAILSEWAGRLDLPCAWLSLDRYDNDLMRFLEYLKASIQKIGVEVEIPSSNQVNNGLGAPFLVSLLNDIASFDPGFILILDDYHRIQNEQVHQLVGYLLENLPENVRLLIATRVDPPLRLARLRAQGAMCEIRAEELRFNEDEAITFLNQSMRLGLETSEVSTLTWKTEGWITGLQLAAISLKDNPERSSFLAAFSGDDRHVADYLVDEALARQSIAVQDFLQQTAILDRLNASLCEAVTGDVDCREILSQLEQANLFLIPLDNVREWYRYHHLFQDLLVHRLHQTYQAAEIKSLHLQASDWYLSRGLIIDAIHHAFEADDMPKIVKLIETNIFAMLDQGGMRTLWNWLDAIPKSYKMDHPWLDIAHALVLVYAGELEKGDNALNLAEETLPGVEKGESDQIKAYIFAIRAYSFWIKGLNEESGELASKAIALTPDDEFTLRAFTYMVLGASYIQRYEFKKAREVLNISIELANRTGNDHIHIFASSNLVFLLINQAKYNEAEQICKKIITEYENRKTETSPAIAQIYALLADIYSKKLKLNQALTLVQKGLEISKRWNQIDTVMVCYVYLVETRLARGEYEQAWEVLEEVKDFSTVLSPWFKDILEETRVKWMITTGNFDMASNWAFEKGLENRDPIPPTKFNTYVYYSRILYREGRLVEAIQLVDRMLVESESKEQLGIQLGLLPLKSLILVEMNEQDEAVKTLEHALAIAEPLGYKRGIVQYGDSIVPLLRLVIKNGRYQNYAMNLLEIIAGEQEEKPPRMMDRLPGHRGMDKELVEPLSDRELQVLQWMAEGCTNQEIAQELVLSLNTIKSHARNIYGKLGVKNRTEAVARARLLAILEG